MKIIAFNIIASKNVGLGHLYRAITLAQGLQNYNIVFFCEANSYAVTKSISKNKFQLIRYNKNNLIDKIKILNPDLLINDILNTTEKYMNALSILHIKTLNFEDLGEGSKFASLVINELYDNPVNSNNNVLWGHEYFCLREEFVKSKPNKYREKLKNILITFGGTDQHNLTLKILNKISHVCKEYKIKIYVVTGAGYKNIKSLKRSINLLSKDKFKIYYTHSAGMMSKIMSKCDVAFTSNGRTVYELSEMNIPSIVISQHERENTHLFANKKNGFIPIGIYQNEDSIDSIEKILLDIILKKDFRKMYYNKIKKVTFKKNKKKVIKIINSLINEKDIRTY